MKDLSKFSAVIIGAGDATGSAITKKFASQGYKVCPVRRPTSIKKLEVLSEEISAEGGYAKGFGVDARDEEAVIKLFEEIFNVQKKRIYKALLNSSSKEVINFNNVLNKIINEKI